MISSYSVPSAISKLMAQKLAQGQYRNAQRGLSRCACLLIMAVGVCFGLHVFRGDPGSSRPLGLGTPCFCPDHFPVRHSRGVPRLLPGAGNHGADLRIPDPGTDCQRRRLHRRGCAHAHRRRTVTDCAGAVRRGGLRARNGERRADRAPLHGGMLRKRAPAHAAGHPERDRPSADSYGGCLRKPSRSSHRSCCPVLS